MLLCSLRAARERQQETVARARCVFVRGRSKKKVNLKGAAGPHCYHSRHSTLFCCRREKCFFFFQANPNTVYSNSDIISLSARGPTCRAPTQPREMFYLVCTTRARNWWGRGGGWGGAGGVGQRRLGGRAQSHKLTRMSLSGQVQPADSLTFHQRFSLFLSLSLSLSVSHPPSHPPPYTRCNGRTVINQMSGSERHAKG